VFQAKHGRISCTSIVFSRDNPESMCLQVGDLVELECRVPSLGILSCVIFVSSYLRQEKTRQRKAETDNLRETVMDENVCDTSASLVTP
jgi:acyl-CoA hydrolase